MTITWAGLPGSIKSLEGFDLVWMDDVSELSTSDIIGVDMGLHDSITVVTERRGNEFYGFRVMREPVQTSNEQRLLQSCAAKPLAGLAK